MISRRPASFLLSLLVLPLALSTAGCNSLHGISIIPATGSVQLTSAGEPVQFTAVGTSQMGSASPTTTNITDQVSWSVSNPSVASINSAGLATALSSGHTEVIAQSNGITATSDITVNITNSSGSGSGNPFIALTPGTAVDTFVGETTQFEATGSLTGGTAQNLNSQVQWISSNAQVAIIDQNGLATAVGAGATTIIAQSGGTNTTATLTVNISSNSSAATIALVPTGATATFQGETTQFIALGTLTAGDVTKNLTGSPFLVWSSSDVAVATVDQNGLATAVGTNLTSESTTITAIGTTSTGSLISANATLTVLPASGQGSQTTLPTLAVYMTGTGTGSITSSPGTLACGVVSGSCTNNFAKTTVVTLTAAPSAGSVFAGWSSNCAPVVSSATDPTSGQHLQCTITMSNNMTVGGIFNP